MKRIFTQLGLGLFIMSLFGGQAWGIAAVVEDFSDVKDSFVNFEAIDYLRERGVIEGYADGTYKPEQTINRAEFLKIVMEASLTDADGANCYPDVKGEWFAKYVCKATKLGLVKGYNDGYFRPAQEINFVEAAKIVANTMKLEIGTEGAVWYEKYVNALDANSAVPSNIGGFDYKVTRGDMAEIVWRVNEQPENVLNVSYQGLKRREVAAVAGDTLQHFESCYDLGDYLEESSQTSYLNKYTIMESVDAPMATATAEEGLGAADDSSVDFSTTNVQVEGVDEADIVKNDGQYIYVLKGDTVRIVRAAPPGVMQELEKVTFDEDQFYPRDMYVEDSKLVVIGYSYDNGYSTTSTKVYIFDISDKENVELIRKVSFEGDYSSSRKVGDMVYLVTNKYEYNFEPMPLMRDADVLPLYSDTATDNVVAPVVGCGDVWYPPGVKSTNYITVAGIPVDADSEVNSEVILGSSANIYASRENLYIAEQKYGWFWIEDAADEEETLIHKFSLGEDIGYLGKGNVSGHILNQFSMDEYNGNFRIATTKGEVWNSDELSTNNVYILDGNLKPLSNIEGIAPGEAIYSVRFMGARLYMVTFKKTDPFFVIDVEDPKAPKILGKLKIPGYSDYLHPYDENHIIGFGKNAVDASEEEMGMGNLDFAWYQGMKVAMFDVTDVANPTEMFKVEIGDRGTSSELLYNHKALLFDKEKGIMAFPVTLAEISAEDKANPDLSADTYGDTVFQGAYIYDVNLTDGFTFKGRISHYTDGEVAAKSGFYWGGLKNVFRILYIGDYLYTVSEDMVKANNMVDLEEVNSVELVPGLNNGGGDYVIY